MTNYCDLRHKYASEGRSDAYKLIEYKHAVLTHSFKLAYSRHHSGQISINAQTDMQKSLSMHFLTYSHTWLFRHGFIFTNSFNFKHRDCSLDMDISKTLFNDSISVSLSSGFDKNGIFPPSLGVNAQLSKRLSSDCSISQDQFKVGASYSKDNYSLSMSASQGRDSRSVTAGIGYRLSPNIQTHFNQTLKFGKQLQITHSLGVTYQFSSSKHLGVFLNTTLKNYTLVSNCVILSLYVHGYNCKLPIFIGNQVQEKPVLRTCLAIFLGCHLFAYGMLRLMK